MHAADAPFACENCQTALQGGYCHVCGQAATNPLRHVGHAVEEFFESFWHLDGRVFRTLRELFVPGRVACNYLAGQRARYIAPLRLFVVATVLTFFLAGFAAQPGDSTFRDAAEDNPAITRATSVEAVEAALTDELARLQLARDKTGGVPGVAAALSRAEDVARRQAADRLTGLGAPAARIESVRKPAPGEVETGGQGIALMMTKHGGPRPDPGRPWNARTNPVDIGWLPDFGDRWFNHRAANAVRNVDEMQGDPSYGTRLVLGALPSALFVLVPVFALLLKLLYVRSDWRYLEHLVVGLYSHVFLLMGVIALALLAALGSVVERIAWLGAAWAGLQLVVMLGLPAYLLWMQKRVYRQGWGRTLLKYALLGGVYVLLVVGAALYSALAGFTSAG